MVKRLEQLTNVAILVVCGLIGYLVVMPRVLNKAPVQEWLLTGKRLEFAEGLPLGAPVGSRAVLLVLDRHCRYCAKGLPFYRELVKAARERGHRVVLLMRDKTETIREYEREHDLRVNEVIRGDPQGLGLQSVPTVLLVDAKGVVLKAWIGLLDKQREAAVIEALN